MKFANQIRKIHRFFSIPMMILVIANLVTKSTEWNQFVEPFTAVNMLLMTITGAFLFYVTKPRKRKNTES